MRVIGNKLNDRKIVEKVMWPLGTKVEYVVALGLMGSLR